MLHDDSNDDEETEPNNQKYQNRQRAAADDKKRKRERIVLTKNLVKKTGLNGWKKSWKTDNFFPGHQIGGDLGRPGLWKDWR